VRTRIFVLSYECSWQVGDDDDDDENIALVLPIQAAVWDFADGKYNAKAISFIPLLAEEGFKLNVGGDGMRGGLLCENEFIGNVLQLFGQHNENPLLNTIMVYDVEFSDHGEVCEYSGANILAENMYAQVDADGHTHTMLDSIIDYYSKNSNAISSKEDGYVITKRGRRRQRMSTAGWRMLNVLWKDGSEQ